MQFACMSWIEAVEVEFSGLRHGDELKDLSKNELKTTISIQADP